MPDNQHALLIQQLKDAADAADAAAAAAAPSGEAPLVPPVSTLAPALANTDTVFLDLTCSTGGGATESLTSSPFDFTDPSDLPIFLDLVLKKSLVYGWNPILTIPVTNGATGVVTTHNLLEEYGVIPLASITTHVTTYYDTQTKQAQDSFMACQCLISSLSLDFLKVITAETPDYHLPAIVAGDGPIPCGPLLLKIIISKANVIFIRTSLTKLDNMMVDLDSNVPEFNLYVKSQVNSLFVRGETFEDLLNNLFKGYGVVNDSEFQEFIKHRENEYEEGHNVGVNNLMAEAIAKYRAIVLSRMLKGLVFCQLSRPLKIKR
jgi:hypothetical protein